MAQLAHRRYSLFDQSQGDLRAKSGAYVHVLPPGGTVVSVNYVTQTVLGVLVTYTDFTLQAGHGFSVGQRFIVGTDTTSFGQILSAQSTNVLRAQGSYNAVAGDLLVNLGSDTGSTSPNWDDSTIPIYLTSDGSGGAESPSRVTTSEEGEWEYWTANRRLWEVPRTTGGVVLDIVQDPLLISPPYLEIRPEDFGAVGDGTTDDTAALEAALAYLETLQGGLLRLSTKTYLASYIKLRTRVRIEGTGKGSILKLKASTNANFVQLNESKVVQAELANLSIDGNKANNTSGHAVYLYKDFSGFDSTYATSTSSSGQSFFLFDRVYVFNAPQSGFYVDGVGTVSSTYYNVREAIWRECDVWGCGHNGMYLSKLTDSQIIGCVVHSNTRNGIEMVSCANDRTLNTKTYFNGSGDPATYKGWNVSGSNRMYFTACEAQEEYGGGVHLLNCDDCDIAFNVEDSGRVGTENTGLLIEDCTNIQGAVRGATNHSPAWQARTLRLDNSQRVHLNLVSSGQTVTDYDINGTGCADVLLHHNGLFIIRENNSRTEIRSDDESTNDAGFTIDPHPGTGSANAFVKVFRGTSTSGARQFRIFKGDGTSTVQVTLNGADGSITGTGALRMGSADVNITGNDNVTTASRFLINLTNVSGTNTITLSAPSNQDGQPLILRCAALTAGTMTLADSGNCVLSAAWVPDAGDTLSLIANGVVWYELSRSAN